jgi:hypothetical protein
MARAAQRISPLMGFIRHALANTGDTVVISAERLSTQPRARLITGYSIVGVPLMRSLSVEEVSKSAISRVKGISWNTVHRWLERAAASCRRFSQKTTTKLEISELQADEICTFVCSKEKSTWIFTALDVWSRFWPASVVGRRSYSNKSRGQRAQRQSSASTQSEEEATSPTARQARKGWAALIRQVYESDPLCCPKCGSEMKIIAFIEPHQSEVIENILRHCGLWDECRGPPEVAGSDSS